MPNKNSVKPTGRHKRVPVSLSISNAEEILDPESYSREMFSYRENQSYGAVKMAQILNSSVNSGIKFKSIFPRTSKNDGYGGID